MSVQDLEKPLIDSGIRSVNFFNGRLLTANDLRREQQARHTADRWLGQAVGDGVAYGLEVKKHPQSTAQEPLVTVEAGLAVNRDGQALRLKSQATVALVRKFKEAAVEGAAFVQCGGAQTGTYIAGPGVYLLTIAPVRAAEGKAPTTGFDPFGGKCNTDAIVETLLFRLVHIDTEQLMLPVPGRQFAELSKFRSRLAYECLGVQQRIKHIADPLQEDFQSSGLIESMRGQAVTDCDVPLALVYWTLSGGIEFVDMWSARRRVSLRNAKDAWSSLLGDRALAEAEAILQQFEDQIGSLRSPAVSPEALRAADCFHYLPPAGVVPLNGVGAARGVQPSVFFSGLTTRGPVHIEGAKLRSLLRTAIEYEPIALESREAIWLYVVRENVQSAQQGEAQPMLVFASGHIPYRGDSRFDLAYWNYSNYAHVG